MRREGSRGVVGRDRAQRDVERFGRQRVGQLVERIDLHAAFGQHFRGTGVGADGLTLRYTARWRISASSSGVSRSGFAFILLARPA